MAMDKESCLIRWREEKDIRVTRLTYSAYYRDLTSGSPGWTPRAMIVATICIFLLGAVWEWKYPPSESGVSALYIALLVWLITIPFTIILSIILYGIYRIQRLWVKVYADRIVWGGVIMYFYDIKELRIDARMPSLATLSASSHKCSFAAGIGSDIDIQRLRLLVSATMKEEVVEDGLFVFREHMNESPDNGIE